MTASKENGQGTCLFGESSIAYQRVEALFDLLRRPATAVAAPAADVLGPGSVLSEFTILRPLASGGMGHVYLARQESLGRLVALKVCKPEMARDARIKSRFQTEALSLAQLAHPNVVPVVSTGEEQGYLYLAMEYIAGPTLAQVLEAMRAVPADTLASMVVARVLADPQGDNQSRPWGDSRARLDRAFQTWAVQTLQQVAQGLAAAHAAGILHRDIKPSNIVFGANGVPKIVDFGLARTALAPSTTVAGEFYGTPAYTSPEQARGDSETVSPASDVFSFGVTLYECLSLERPFPGRNSADVLSAVVNSDAPLLRHVEKRIPWELEAITDKCLRKTAAERYPSGQALADDLRNYLELRSVTARSPSMIGRVGRMIRRRPGVAAFMCPLATAAVFGGFLAKRAWTDYQAEKIKTIAKRVDEGDVALFRCLTGQRPMWLPSVIEQYRQQGITAYTAALDFDPDAVRPLVQRARLYASKKEDLRLALADLDRAQQFQPGFGSIRKFRGFVLDQLGRNDEGRAAREEAKTLYPTAADDLYWLGVVAHTKEQDFSASYDYFSRALLVAPNDYWSRVERVEYGGGPSEKGIDKSKRSIVELETAKLIRPDLPFASETLAIRKSMLDPLSGKNELADQIERFGLNIFRAHGMAEFLEREKSVEEAEAMLKGVLDQDTGGDTAGKIGELCHRRRLYAQAADWYRRAIAEGERHSTTYTNLADALTALGDWKGAENAFTEGIAQNPKDALLYWRLGGWYEAKGRTADAEKTYRRGCDVPDNAEGTMLSQRVQLVSCFGDLASLLARLGRRVESAEVLERGIARFEKASKQQQRNGQSDDWQVTSLKVQLGHRYILDGRRQDAIALLNAEVKRKPIFDGRAGSLINLMHSLGMQGTALGAARAAEFAAQDSSSIGLSSLRNARALVDTELQRMGRSKELVDRIETKRALGEKLVVEDYRRLGAYYQGTEAVAIVREGIDKHPRSVSLLSDYTTVLAKAGQKDAAWDAYEKGRDLYFSIVGKTESVASPLWLLTDLQDDFRDRESLSPEFFARQWYTFLLQEMKDEEFHRLDQRLRGVCQKMGTDAKNLLLPRATAEYGTGRYTAAVKSLEACLREGRWNELASEAMLTGALARSHRALGHRQDAIAWFRRAMEVSGVHAGLLAEFLCLVVEDQGVDGLRRELVAFDRVRLNPDAMRSATLGCFAAWAALAKGDDKAAFEKLVQADTSYLAASQIAASPQAGPVGEEALVCAVLLQIVAEQLADKRAAGLAEFVKRFPAERVRMIREVFTLPK
jgi:serine/threonine protein kinase/tetratricopeptide (TPR) repeat protein